MVCLGDYQYNIMDKDGNLMCKEDYPGMADEIIEGKVKVGDGEGGVNFVDVKTGNEMWGRFKKEMYYEKEN